MEIWIEEKKTCHWQKQNLDKGDEEIDNKNNDWIVHGNGDSEHQLEMEEEKRIKKVGTTPFEEEEQENYLKRLDDELRKFW